MARRHAGMSAGMDIELHAVSVRRGRTWALREVTWQLRAGERWALIGANGSGKTQLLKLLSGAVWPTPSEGDAPDGEWRRYRRGRRDLDPVTAKSHIAYVGGESQDKYARYGWNLAVHEVVATGLHDSDILLRPVTAAQTARVRGMLRTCRLTRLAGRQFLSLSYGEKRLVLLARALVATPDWLLLDEFYNGLDATFRTRIDAVLRGAARRGQAWVVSAHRAVDVPRGTARLLELEAGRITYGGRLLRTRIAGLATAKDNAPAQPARRRRGARLIEIRQADLYIEHHLVLRQLDWQLHRGEHWAVFGANGAGKSSFLKLLYGDLAPALGGHLERRGVPRGTPISAWKRRVSWVTPELQSDYLIDVPLVELIASGRHASIGLNEPMSRGDERVARNWLAFFELETCAADRPRELSYGQLRRALMARAMAAEPTLLLLDEPLTGLDPTQRTLMKRLLARLMRGRITLVAAVHHRDDLPAGITHELHLHKRRASIRDLQSAT